MALLNDALLPNLVQTTEGTPALVHTGPFANIAHGTSSALSQRMAIRLADFVVNEAGFDIAMRASGIRPAVAVLVTTVQSLRMQGEGSLEAGLSNLAHHIATLKCFGVPVVVAINRFPADLPADLDSIAAECERLVVPCSAVEAFTKGGLGAVGLAKMVVSTIQANPSPDVQPIYALEDTLEEKIRQVAARVYGAAGVAFSDLARTDLQLYSEWGFARLPVCIAKTQYSLSDDPKLMGAPTGWTLNVTSVSLAAGAGFLVVVAGNMMLMPGLPRVPRALAIDVDADGNITGV